MRECVEYVLAGNVGEKIQSPQDFADAEGHIQVEENKLLLSAHDSKAKRAGSLSSPTWL